MLTKKVPGQSSLHFSVIVTVCRGPGAQGIYNQSSLTWNYTDVKKKRLI